MVRNTLPPLYDLETIPDYVIHMVLKKGFTPVRAWRTFVRFSQRGAARTMRMSEHAYLELERKTWPLTEDERKAVSQAFAISPHQLDIPSAPELASGEIGAAT